MQTQYFLLQLQMKCFLFKLWSSSLLNEQIQLTEVISFSKYSICLHNMIDTECNVSHQSIVCITWNNSTGYIILQVQTTGSYCKATHLQHVIKVNNYFHLVVLSRGKPFMLIRHDVNGHNRTSAQLSSAQLRCSPTSVKQSFDMTVLSQWWHWCYITIHLLCEILENRLCHGRLYSFKKCEHSMLWLVIIIILIIIVIIIHAICIVHFTVATIRNYMHQVLYIKRHQMNSDRDYM